MINTYNAVKYLTKPMSVQLFYYYVRTGRGPKHKIIEGHYYFEVDDVTKWEKPEPRKNGRKAKYAD